MGGGIVGHRRLAVAKYLKAAKTRNPMEIGPLGNDMSKSRSVFDEIWYK